MMIEMTSELLHPPRAAWLGGCTFGPPETSVKKQTLSMRICLRPGCAHLDGVRRLQVDAVHLPRQRHRPRTLTAARLVCRAVQVLQAAQPLHLRPATHTHQPRSSGCFLPTSRKPCMHASARVGSRPAGCARCALKGKLHCKRETARLCCAGEGRGGVEALHALPVWRCAGVWAGAQSSFSSPAHAQARRHTRAPPPRRAARATVTCASPSPHLHLRHVGHLEVGVQRARERHLGAACGPGATHTHIHVGACMLGRSCSCSFSCSYARAHAHAQKDHFTSRTCVGGN